MIPAVAARYGGPSAAVVGMCRALQGVGVSPSIVTTDADGRGRLSVPLGEWFDDLGVPAIVFPRIGPTAFKWAPRLATWLRGHVTDFDLVHVHAVFAHSTLAAGRACQRRSVPYLVRPLGTLAPWSFDRHRWRKELLFALGLRRAVSGAFRIHYTSDSERHAAERRSPWLPAGDVVPLGVDDDFFNVSPSQTATEHPAVVVVSRLDPKKGIDIVIQAAHRLAGESGLPDGWSLQIAGDGDPRYAAFLRRLATEGPAAGRIAFRGWVDPTEHVHLLAGASVSVLLSQQENFGIAAIEAMAAGVPVIVSRHVDLAADIVGAGAGWQADRSPEHLATVLSAVLRDAEGRSARAVRARAFAERYRWARVAMPLKACYERARR